MIILFAVLCLVSGLHACSDSPVNGGNGDPDIDPPINGDVDVYLTTGNRLVLFDRQNSFDFSDSPAGVTITIDETEVFQPVTGFGAAMTGSSAYLITRMEASARTALLEELFDPEEGIGISNIRLTIGASDFSLGNYSYCDEEGIENFAIPATDRRDLIPLMKEILSISPDLWIMASPWSAPAWMKTSGTMNGGRLKHEHFDDFALYLKLYVEAFEAEGIPINAITIQNEPLHETGGYPTMFMPWEDQNVFIRDHLGPLFASSGIDTKIIIYDHNWDNYQYPINILNDQETRRFVDGSAFHGYGGNVGQMSNVSDVHPDKALYFTEISGGGWATGFWPNITWNIDNIFFGTMRNNSQNVILWNLALDEQDGPKNGGCQNCRGVVTIRGNDGIIRNEEYYLLAHLSRFIRPGYRRVSTTINQGNLSAMAFTGDGPDVLVVMNNTDFSQQFRVTSAKGNFIYTIPGQALGTFIWQSSD
ncbi:MAG: glycoside hydrolase family 30 protein [Cyclonatronaceae bacterium]